MEDLELGRKVMRIFLTGASGFIGRHVLGELGKRHEVIALTNHTWDTSALSNVFFVRGDLLRGGEAERLIEQYPAQILIHLAWHVPPGTFWNDPLNIDWMTASLELARAFVRQGGKRMVLAGSCAEYDWSGLMPLQEETSPVKPKSLYGVCKNSLRQAVAAYAASADVSCLWCRIFWPYGVGEAPEKFLSSIIRSLHRGERAVCRGANLRRDYIHVTDVARAVALAAESSLTGILNIGRGEAVTLGELAGIAANAMGRSDLLKLGCAEISEANPEIVVASVRRLTNELGWRPQVSLLEGIRDMTEIMDSLGEEK